MAFENPDDIFRVSQPADTTTRTLIDDMTQKLLNIDPAEISKFDEQAKQWWDPDGELKALHDINGLRLEYVATRTPLSGEQVLDAGCGGGLFSEALASAGARVTGIDMAGAQLDVARSHARVSGYDIRYEQATAEDFAARQGGGFHAVTCMELLEHVPDPASVVNACARLVKPGGMVFFSTLNRTALSFLLAIAAAEYLLNIVKRGTHQYHKFIRPEELKTWAKKSGLEFVDLTGFSYLPFIRRAGYSGSARVNYLMCFRRLQE